MDFCRTFTPVLISLRTLSMIHHDELEQNVYCWEYLYIKLPGKQRYTSIVFFVYWKLLDNHLHLFTKLFYKDFPSLIRTNLLQIWGSTFSHHTSSTSIWIHYEQSFCEGIVFQYLNFLNQCMKQEYTYCVHDKKHLFLKLGTHTPKQMHYNFWAKLVCMHAHIHGSLLFKHMHAYHNWAHFIKSWVRNFANLLY